MFIDDKIRRVFKIIDPLDYNRSSILNNIYKIINFNKFIHQFNNDIKKISINKKLDENGFVQIDSNKKILDKILERHNKISKTKEFIESLAKSKKEFLKVYKINLLEGNNHIFFKFLFENELLEIVRSYLGKYFTLNGAYFLYSKNEKFELSRSQELHLDGDSLKQIKIFVHLSDVDLKSGPLHVLPKKNSKYLFTNFYNSGKIKKRSNKISDNKLEKETLEKILPMVGSRGAINIVDTSNCYHFGSRPGKNDRLILLFQFVSSYSYRTKFFPNKDLILKSKYLNDNEIKKINNIIKFSDFQFR